MGPALTALLDRRVNCAGGSVRRASDEAPVAARRQHRHRDGCLTRQPAGSFTCHVAARESSATWSGLGIRAGLGARRFNGRDKGLTHGSGNVERRNRVRAGEHSGGAVQRDARPPAEVSPAARQGRIAGALRARLPVGREAGRLGRSGQGLRVREGPVRRPHEGRLQDRRAREDEDGGHPRLRRPEGSGRALLRDARTTCSPARARTAPTPSSARRSATRARSGSRRSSFATRSIWPRSKSSAMRWC